MGLASGRASSCDWIPLWKPPPLTLHVRLILTVVTENGSCASVHYMALDRGSERLNDLSKVTRWVTRMPCPWHLACRAK